MRIYTGLIMSALALGACSKSSVKITGQFNNVADKEKVYLEIVNPDKQATIDSVEIRGGKFKFRVKLADSQPTIYNIRQADQIVPLMLQQGDRVKVNALGNISQTYTVSGSELSEQMHEITMIMNHGAASLDSLTNVFTKTPDSTRNVIATQYSKKFYQIKRQQVKFIVANCTSPTAIYALYQRLPNDNMLFNGESDVIYYRMVADSVGSKSPDSKYLAALAEEVKQYDSAKGVQQLLNNAIESGTTATYPDFTMTDMYGKSHALSSLAGKVILLQFWSAASTEHRLANADLKETYQKYASQGFEIYQVSVDTNKAAWVTMVQDQKLPWISVCDFKGVDSTPVKLFNVQKVPANFLIDKAGNIVARDISQDKLEERLKAMF